MLKLSIKILISGIILQLFAIQALALESDKKADFVLDADNNSAILKSGENQQRFWGNVVIQQGTLKINADSALVTQGKNGIDSILLKGKPVKMEQVIDAEYGKINVRANQIDYKVTNDLLEMTGDVLIKSKIQGEMSGEKITMNTKTKEIKGAKSNNQRVRLVIKQQED